MAGVELATGYVSIIPSARGFAAGLEKELGAPLIAAGRVSGAKSSESFKKSFVTGMKSLAVGVGVVAGITAVGQKFEGAFNTIERGTGATGKTLESLDNSFRTVLKSGSGSFDQVSQAVTTLFQRTRLTGPALDDFAKKQVTLARITKTDVAANLQATTGLFNLYGVAAAKQSEKLDVLFKASQVAGVSVTQLASDMQSAAPTAKILGLNIDQTAGLVANLDKAGLPASKVMLGLAGAFARAAKAGKDPLSVVHDLVAEVKKAPNATVAATVAVTKFGIGARQASTLVAGIRSGAIDLTKSLSGGKGILDTAKSTQTLSGQLAHLRNVALVGLEPLAKQALGAVTRGVQILTPIVGQLADHMNILGPAILAAGGAFATFKVAQGTAKIFTATSTGVRTSIAALKAFRTGLLTTGSKVTGFFKAGGGSDTLRLRFLQLGDAAKSAASTIAKGVKSVLSYGKSVLISAVNTGRQVAAFIAQKVAAIAAAVAQKLLTAAQWLLNAAMSANPIGLIVIALVALGVAVFEAYKHFGPFRAAVDKAWQILQSLFHWVQANWPLLLAILTGPIGIAVLFIIRHFDQIKTGIANALNAVVGFVKQWWPLILAPLTGGLSLVVGVFVRHFDQIKSFVGNAINAVVGFFAALPGRILGFVGVVGGAAVALGKSILNGIVSGVSSAVGAVADIGKAIANSAIRFINKSVLSHLRGGIRDLANALANVNIPGVGRAFDAASSLLNATASNIPDIPQFAHGGVITEPTLGIIGERARSNPEIISPVALMAETFRAELEKGGGRGRQIVQNNNQQYHLDHLPVEEIAIQNRKDTMRLVLAGRR